MKADLQPQPQPTQQSPVTPTSGLVYWPRYGPTTRRSVAGGFIYQRPALSADRIHFPTLTPNRGLNWFEQRLGGHRSRIHFPTQSPFSGYGRRWPPRPRMTTTSRPPPYFMTLTAMVLVLSALRAAYLLTDAYNAGGLYAAPVNYLLFNLPVPCLTSAFSILFMALLSATQVQMMRPRVQSAGALASVIAFHFAFSVGTDLIVGLQFEGRFLLALCQLMFICWGLALSVTYWYIFGTLYRAAVRRQAEALRTTVTKLQIEGSVMPRRLPRPTLGLAVRLTVIVSVLGLLLAVLQAYGMVWVYDAFGVFSARAGGPQPWAWWCYQTLSRAVELLLAGLLLYVGSQPLRYHEPRRRPACAVFALCTGACAGRPRLLRPKPQQAGRAAAELDYYPAVCSRNQVVQSASQDGRLAYTDRLPLAGGHAISVSLPQRRTMRRSASADRTSAPAGSRPSSLLQPAPPLVPPPPPEPPHVETTYQPVLRAAAAEPGRATGPASSTLRSSGTQTSEEYTDVCATYCLPVGGRPSLDTDELSSAAPTPSRALCRQASTCSSESAAHSFTVRLYRTVDGPGRPRPRAAPGAPAAGPATCPRAARHRLSCPLPPDDASDAGLGSVGSDAAVNFLTDVSTSGSTSQPNLSDSRECSEAGVLSRGASDPSLDGSPRRQRGAAFSLPLRRPAAADATSDDITPDSAVVVDYDDACDVCAGGDARRGAGAAGEGYQSVAPAEAAAAAAAERPRARRGAARFLPATSAGSLQEVLRRYRSRSGSRGLLDKLRGSTFSLQVGRHGYSPLGSTGSVPQSPGPPAQLVDGCTQTDFPPPSLAASRSDLTSEPDLCDVTECDVTDMTSSADGERLRRLVLGGRCAAERLDLERCQWPPEEETGV
ncbi:hypothetical protein FJT64_021925 [Amphibalanus amphitrite]|uniref:Proline-rich transmembrane protein 3/4 domain-containing protein n=1 Tax=Amphibalanus amphitrite TaxID=1232801 RepID=A0A6A4WKE6_AMPAM|nr:hypothetical protein FJT64_021925 [Amphibalanus amphitrite]